MSAVPVSLPRFVVLGEALTDFVRTDSQAWHSVAGGACWNVARVAGTLGIAAAWAGAVSEDFFGDEIAVKSQAAHLDARFLQRARKPPLIAMVHQLDPPAYFFLGNDTADLAFDEALLPADWQQACDIAHFGCISLVRQPLAERLMRIAADLKQQGVKISYDPNYRNLMGADFADSFERMARLADIIKLSDEDLAQIYKGLSPAAALARVREVAANAMILFTRGAGGVALHVGDRVIEQPAFAVNLADTVGAGDACIGGFVSSLLFDPSRDAAQALRFAAATAAAACMRAGAHAPSLAEVEALLQRGEAGGAISGAA
ncbi:carbohydrate kinase family protein [Solimonas terrae]|uniref:Carbohydrate kinase n=1 Tax=Solimonas terrae TaxID=1396819 RepID=A0A6M2BU24_9GAMM|nr:carbohydrate kinase [Solimonas terrae]NGY05840.1 carbohydrate kinase [Solimonas terrae]